MSNIILKVPGVEIPPEASFEITEKRGLKRLHGVYNALQYDASIPQSSNFALAIEQPDGSVKLVPTNVADVAVTKEEDEDDDQVPASVGWQERNALGETFGTKKAKSAITDKSRNRVEAETLEDLQGSIVDRVKIQTSSLPSQNERVAALEQDRQIPPYDLATRSVKDVFPLHLLVPPRELNLVNITELQNAAQDERAQHLPFAESQWVNSRIDSTISDGVTVVSRLRLLAYLSFLMAVYASRRITSKDRLSERLGNPPEDLIAGVIERFTVAKAGFVGRSHDRSFAFDPANIDKLLSYILVLALHIDEFSVEVNSLGHDLGIKASKVVNLFRNVGCNIKSETAEVKGRKVAVKVAVLTAPLTLPSTMKRGRQQ